MREKVISGEVIRSIQSVFLYSFRERGLSIGCLLYVGEMESLVFQQSNFGSRIPLGVLNGLGEFVAN